MGVHQQIRCIESGTHQNLQYTQQHINFFVNSTPLVELLILKRDWKVLLIQFSSHFFSRSKRLLPHDGCQYLDI